MNCDKCQALLTDYSRGELEAAVRDSIDEHLADCADCAAALAMLDALDALPDAEPSPQLAAGFQARLAAELHDKPARAGFAAFFQAFWPSRPAAAFSYSLALIFCGLIGGQLLPPGSLGFGHAMLTENPAERPAQLCPIQNSPVNDLL